MVSGYLEANYDKVCRYLNTSSTVADRCDPQFFTAYKDLVLSPNYVTKRQSLKLLGEILLDRSNYAIMTRYIASVENLQIIMNTLRDKSKNIQFEAFHVFKVRLSCQLSAVMNRVIYTARHFIVDLCRKSPQTAGRRFDSPEEQG